MASPTTFLISLKATLIAAGAVSIAFAVKFSVPLIIGFCYYEVPILWTSFQTWLRPPYLYFVINGIIIIIAATSKFSNQIHHNHPQVHVPETGHPPVQDITIRAPPPSDVEASLVFTSEVAPAPASVEVGHVYDYYVNEEDESEAKVLELKPVVVNGVKQLGLETVDWEDGDDDDNVSNSDAWIVPKADFIPAQEINFQDVTQLEFVSPPVKEKPLVLSRFHFPKPTTTNKPEGGRAMRVVARRRRQQAEEHDTMENTWRMITQSRHVLPIPVTRQLTKSDTWDNHGRGIVMKSRDLDLLDLPPPPPPPRQVSKSATFRDRKNNYDSLTTVPPAGKIRKEPSLTPEEVNRRAEEFIKKFNEEMRLQRQESLNKYME